MKDICIIIHNMIKKIIKNKYLLVTIIFSLLLIAFACIVPADLYFHDAGTFGGFDEEMAVGIGHFGLMEFIAKFHKLPDFDVREVYGFYNPPVYYVICAFVINICKNISINKLFLKDCVQFVNVFFCIASSGIFYLLLNKIKFINEKIKFPIFIMFLFHPWMFYFAIQCTNDCLLCFFTLCAIYLSICFHENKKISTIILLALCFGLGMATKLSMAFMAVPIAFVFIYDFIYDSFFYTKNNLIVNEDTNENVNNSINKNANANANINANTNTQSTIHLNPTQYIIRYLIFLLIASPIALFYPIRNFVKFGIPFNFIQLWKGPMHPGFDYVLELLHINPIDFLTPFQFDSVQGIFMNTIKSSLFDEYEYFEYLNIFGSIALIIATLLFVFIIYLFIKYLITKQKTNSNNYINEKLYSDNKIILWFLSLAIITYILAYFKFCYNYPKYFSINFRYIYLTYPAFLILVAYMLSKLNNEKYNKIFFVAYIILAMIIAIIFIPFFTNL